MFAARDCSGILGAERYIHAPRWAQTFPSVWRLEEGLGQIRGVFLRRRPLCTTTRDAAMPSEINHSPGAPAVSRAGFSAAESAVDRDPLDALIVESDRAARLLEALDDDPVRQAALADLAEQSARAADSLYALERATGGPPSSRRTP
jgi:hypothetical protein